MNQHPTSNVQHPTSKGASARDAVLQVECPLCFASVGECCDWVMWGKTVAVHLSRMILWEQMQAQALAQEVKPLTVDNVDAVMALAEVQAPFFRGGWWWATVPGVIGPELADDQHAALRQLRQRVIEEWARVTGVILSRCVQGVAEGRAA